MSALDALPPDQRAVLQMVLQRGRSYDEIAGLLSIDRAAVRKRALDAFDALAPPNVLPGPERALVTDYLLRQLPERVAEQVYAYLAASEPDRAWAHELAEVITPLTSATLPEIPVGAPLGADDRSAGELEQAGDPPVAEPAAVQPPAAEPRAARPPSRGEARQREPRPAQPRRSSRRGGVILLSTVGVAIIAVIVFVALSSGGSKQPSSAGGGHTIAGKTTPATSSTTVTTGTSTTSRAVAMLAQLNLSSPTGARTPLGIAQVERVDGVIGVVIYAQHVPANTAHNAYAIWLYNSPTSYRFVGFVPTLVGKSGNLATEGRLKPWATRYHRLLVTLETQPKPTTPGQVVLSGPFRERS